MRIKDLATRATKLLTGNAWFVVDNGTKVEKAAYSEVVKQGIEEYAGSTLAGSARTVKSAIDALNSNLKKYIIVYNANYSVSGDTYNSPSISQAIDAIATKGNGRYFVECRASSSYSDTYNTATTSNTSLVIDVIGTAYINVFAITVGNLYGVTLYRSKTNDWGDWIKQPLRTEIDSLDARVAALENP